MKITKQQLIQEGILQGVKDNWGKGLLAAGGIAAANAGVFGPTAQNMVKLGKGTTEKFVKDAGDWSKEAVDKMNAKYGVDVNNDGHKEMIDTSKTTTGSMEPTKTETDSPNDNPEVNLDTITDALGLGDN